MNVQRGDVVMVDWIYSDRTGSKRRPALVIQANVYNAVLDDTILALITGSTRRRVGAATQLEIDISTPDGQQTGLSIDSVVRKHGDYRLSVGLSHPRETVGSTHAED